MSTSERQNGVQPASISLENANKDVGQSEEDDGKQQAQAFLHQHGRVLHPALDPRSCSLLEESGNKKKPLGHVFKETLDIHTKEFIEAVEAYRDGWQDPRIRALSLRQKTSWEQVIQEVRQAEERYKLAGQSGIRKLTRRASAMSSAIVPYLRLLPNDSMWLPAVGGALKLVFEAFDKVNEKREYILGFLVRIPDVIIHTEDTCANFGPDPILYAKAEKVYIAALTAIEGTVKWLSKKATGRTITAIMLGPLYGKSFKDKLSDIDGAVKALEAHISPIRDSYIAKTQRGIQHFEEQMESLEQLQQASKTAIDKMMEVLADTNRTAKWMQEKDSQIRRLKLRVQQFEQASSALSVTDLLDILALPNTHPDGDLQQAFLRIDPNGGEAELALKVNSGQVFKEWQGEDEAPPLFIEGGLPPSNRRSTALGIISSTLIKSQEGSPCATSIYYFCGMHDNTQDSICGPQGLLRSLVGQILQKFDVNLDFISMLSRPLIEKLNIRALCDCFAKLVKQLPARTVLFCIIDGVSFFETALWANDTAKVIGDLRALAYDSDVGAIFKLLVTSPRRSKFVASIFEPETRLTVGDTRRHGSERDVKLATRRTSATQVGIRTPLLRTLRPEAVMSTVGHRSERAAQYDSLSDSELLDL